MTSFRFQYPIEVRYGDLDPQGHVNNAKYLTYMEQARVGYLTRLGLWDGRSFLDVGIILAEVQVRFLAPVYLGQDVQVRIRVPRLGNKSLVMEYSIIDAQEERELATGSTVLVAYDYRLKQTIPVPDGWRKAMAAFEGIPERTTP